MSVHSSCVNVTGLCVRIQHLMNINHGGFPSLGMQLTIAWICMRWSCSLLVDWVSHESHGDSCRGLWCSGLYIATCLSQQALSIPSCIRSALTRWKLSLLQFCSHFGVGCRSELVFESNLCDFLAWKWPPSLPLPEDSCLTLDHIL